MNQTFFVQFYNLLGINLADQPRLHEGMHKLILSNVTTVLLTELSETQRESFRSLIKNGKSDTQSVNLWLSENDLDTNEEFAQKINQVIENSVNDFFEVLIKDLDEKKKQEVLLLAQSYLRP